jgi:hypothetical protein
MDRSLTARSLTLVEVCERVLSTSGTSPVTAMLSLVAPTVKWTSSVMTAPTARSISVRRTCLKPALSTVME